MEDPQLEPIKSLNPCKCPSCGVDIIVEYQFRAPVLVNTYTPTSVIHAKERFLRELSLLAVPKKQREDLEEWIRDPEIIMAPEDIDKLLEDIVKDYGRTQKSTKSNADNS